MTTSIRTLLTDKYRPSTIEGYVYQTEDVERTVTKWVEQQSIPNVLLAGTPGTGKTTLSRILVNELGIDQLDTLEMNASEMRMEDIREQIMPFITRSGFSKVKIIQLEEADRMTFDQQKVLLKLIEDNSERIRWILTCNYINKIDPALLSRLETGTLILEELNEEAVLNHIIDIIEAEAIIIEDDNDLLSHIAAFGTDLRRIIGSIERHLDKDGRLYPRSESTESADLGEFESIFIGGNAGEQLPRLLDITEHCDHSNFEQFYTVMYTHANTANFGDEIGESVVIIAKYLDMAMRTANQRLNLDACLYELFVVGDDSEED